MTSSMWRWASVTVGALAALLALRLTGSVWGAGAAKLVASAGFIMVAVAGRGLSTPYGKWILAGLFCSWWGDAFLIGSGAPFFQLGLVSFLLGHLAYCVAFWVHGVSPRWSAAALAAVLPIAAGVLYWLMPHVPGELRGPVLAYIVVISTMVVFAVGTKGMRGPSVIVIGAILFYASDIAVARAQFVVPDSLDSLWGLPLYFAGQLCLASSVVRD